MKNKSIVWKRNRYKNQRGENHYCAKVVKTPLGVFKTAKDASTKHNICLQTVLNRCRNENNKFKDWEILNECS